MASRLSTGLCLPWSLFSRSWLLSSSINIDLTDDSELFFSRWSHIGPNTITLIDHRIGILRLSSFFRKIGKFRLLGPYPIADSIWASYRDRPGNPPLRNEIRYGTSYRMFRGTYRGGLGLPHKTLQFMSWLLTIPARRSSHSSTTAGSPRERSKFKEGRETLIYPVNRGSRHLVYYKRSSSQYRRKHNCFALTLTASSVTSITSPNLHNQL